MADENFFLKMSNWNLGASLGGYAEGSTKYYEANFTSPTTLSSTINELLEKEQNTVTLTCSSGYLDFDQAYTQYGLLEGAFLAKYTSYMIKTNFNNQENFKKAYTNCQGKKECDITYKPEWFTEEANDYIKGENNQPKHKFYLRYHCTNIEIDLYGNVFPKADLNFAVVIVNLLVFLLALLFLYRWKVNETKIFSNFRQTTPLPSDYALKFKNLPKNTNEEQLKRDLKAHLEKFYPHLNIKSQAIVDMNVSKNNDMLYLDRILKQKRNRAEAYFQKMVEDKLIEVPENQTMDLNFLRAYVRQNPDKFRSQKGKKSLQKMFNELQKVEKLEAKVKKQSNKSASFLSVYVTFNLNVNAVKIYNAMNISSTKRLMMNICPNKDHICSFKDKILKVQHPPQPINIMWENVQVSPFEKRIRRLISFLATIFLIAIPIIIVIVISYNMKNAEPSKITCPKDDVFAEENMTDAKLEIIKKDYTSETSENLMFCYCVKEFRARFNQ